MLRKLPWVVLALAFLATARCYTGDLVAGVAAIPIVGPIVVPSPVPAYVAAIGTPAPLELPNTDPKTWFPAPDGPATKESDWEQMALAAAAARTPAGWAAFCAKATAAVRELTGNPETARVDSPLLGALACSEDPSVTLVQRLALDLFALRAVVVLWSLGAPNANIAAIQARQAALRLTCAGLPAGVIDPAAVANACTAGLDTGYLAGDAKATIDAVEAAYAAVAGAIAARDPAVAEQPGAFGTEAATP